jgi:hypothetical protein
LRSGRPDIDRSKTGSNKTGSKHKRVKEEGGQSYHANMKKLIKKWHESDKRK